MKASKREKMKVAKILEEKEASTWQRKMTENLCWDFPGYSRAARLKEQPGTWET